MGKCNWIIITVRAWMSQDILGCLHVWERAGQALFTELPHTPCLPVLQSCQTLNPWHTWGRAPIWPNPAPEWPNEWKSLLGGGPRKAQRYLGWAWGKNPPWLYLFLEFLCEHCWNLGVSRHMYAFLYLFYIYSDCLLLEHFE